MSIALSAIEIAQAAMTFVTDGERQKLTRIEIEADSLGESEKEPLKCLTVDVH
jgi:hypothetical protein